MRRGYRLAGYTASGDDITDRDVLDAEELAEDWGWISRRTGSLAGTVPDGPDPEDVLAGVEALVALQRQAERAAERKAS